MRHSRKSCDLVVLPGSITTESRKGRRAVSIILLLVYVDLLFASSTEKELDELVDLLACVEN